ncbi:MAG: PrpF domain-containing protein [Clostridia bacterium]|jgi:2-methylaconitate cis-trans-isomerase PrpF|nr:PrpF domain-containing protein [Clostridia bacterium]
MYYPETEKYRCVIMRGGTSKGIFLLENDLPLEAELRDKVILNIFGSPDKRQIDGLGGADTLTSKLAIIGPSSREDAEVNYTFGQVDLTSSFIDYGSNCGNISSAVGPYAIQQGLVKAVEPITKVRIYNTNTKKTFVSEVPVENGRPKETGDFKLAGAPRTGARINLDFAGTAGAQTGKLLPTGRVKDILDVEGVGEVTVSLVDAASATVFIKAADLGLTGGETPQEIDSDPQLLDKLEKIRAKGAEKMGIVKKWQDAVTGMRAAPLIALVAPSLDYVDFITGSTIQAETMDFAARCIFMQVTHKTYSATCTVCTGAAALLPGTVVNEVMRKDRDEKEPVRFGHPGGIIDIDARVEKEGGEFVLKRAAVGRTARRIMEGYAYVPYQYLQD